MRRTSKHYTDQELEIIRKYYPEHGAHRVMEEFKSLGIPGRNRRAIGQTARKYGWLYEGPKLGCFPKGHVPANKGIKMSEELKKKSAHTWFKKGHTPQNHTPVGTRRRRQRYKPGRKDYWWIKIAEPNEWELLHRYIWKEAYGEIPEAVNIQFKDGDQDNLALDNLYPTSRKKQVVINKKGGSKIPFPLRKTIELITDIKLKINEK